MLEDKELNAMATISAALSDLDAGGAGRVLRWAAERHQIELASVKLLPTGTGQLDAGRPAYDDLATLFSEANPKTEAEKALLVGYWFQVALQQKDFESMPINTELKNLGHGVGNITDAMTTLIKRKPALVIQVQKSGSSKQARKRYKLTTAGIRQVDAMLQGLEAASA